MDIEDIIKEGKELKACPYYAARYIVKCFSETSGGGAK